MFTRWKTARLNSGMVQVVAIPIAFSLLIGAAILLFILGTIGLDGKKAGRKYMVRGIKFIIPVILILYNCHVVFIAFISAE